MALLDDVLEEIKKESPDQQVDENHEEGGSVESGGEPKRPMHSYSQEFEEFAKNSK